jgi:cytochrome c biogenesis protein CcdA
MFQPVGLLWGIVSLIFGILVVVYPRFLQYTVGIYLIIVGLWAIIPRLHF